MKIRIHKISFDYAVTGSYCIIFYTFVFFCFLFTIWAGMVGAVDKISVFPSSIPALLRFEHLCDLLFRLS